MGQGDVGCGSAAGRSKAEAPGAHARRHAPHAPFTPLCVASPATVCRPFPHPKKKGLAQAPALLTLENSCCQECRANLDPSLPRVVLHAIRHLKPRLFGQGCVANPRDTYWYRCGLRLALTKNPSVLNVPSSLQHHTRSASPDPRPPERGPP